MVKQNLTGAAAQSVIDAAAEIENQALKAQAERIAQGLSAKARDEMIHDARAASFTRGALWMYFLPISRRQREVLARIYSFQCTTNKEGTPGEYRMSLANGAAELNIDRANFKHDIKELIALGFIIRRSNGERKPATYLVDEVVCLTEARKNGYEY